jgi:hypothetical protein
MPEFFFQQSEIQNRKSKVGGVGVGDQSKDSEADRPDDSTAGSFQGGQSDQMTELSNVDIS